MNLEYRELSKENWGMVIADTNGNVLYDPLYDVNENALSKIDRLGLAWCRLNSWKWDEFIGPKPEGFDALPDWDKYGFERIEHPIIMRLLSWIMPKKFEKKVTKRDYIGPATKRIEDEIGIDNALRCHWIYGMNRTEDEWSKWWATEHIKGLDC